MSFFRPAALLFGAGMISVLSLPHAQGSDLEQEYQQVRKIAMKDPKVRAAFDRAHDTLNKRIIEIDPALKPFVQAQGARKKLIAPSRGALSRSPTGATHFVAKGETLTSIARRYKVDVNRLAKTNNIAKEATLQVGQKLVMPATARE